MTGTFYNRMTLTLAAGETRQVNAYGRYFRILGNTIATDPMVIIGDQAGEQKVSSGLGLELPVDLTSDNSFARLLIRNPSASEMVLDLAISSGKIDDSRLSVSGSITIQDGGGSITVDNADITAAAASVASIKTDTRSLNGDTGTLIAKEGTIINAGNTVIHTVTSGKTLYLTNSSLLVTGNTNGGSRLLVTDASDNTQYTIQFARSQAVNDLVITTEKVFPRPLKIPAGYKIKVVNGYSGDTSSAFIIGWEE